MARFSEYNAAGAEAPPILLALSARLKSCPRKKLHGNCQTAGLHRLPLIEQKDAPTQRVPRWGTVSSIAGRLRRWTTVTKRVSRGRLQQTEWVPAVRRCGRQAPICLLQRIRSYSGLGWPMALSCLASLTRAVSSFFCTLATSPGSTSAVEDLAKPESESSHCAAARRMRPVFS